MDAVFHNLFGKHDVDDVNHLQCSKEPAWHIFLASSVLTFILLLIPVVIGRYIWLKRFERSSHGDDEEKKSNHVDMVENVPLTSRERRQRFSKHGHSTPTKYGHSTHPKTSPQLVAKQPKPTAARKGFFLERQVSFAHQQSKSNQHFSDDGDDDREGNLWIKINDVCGNLLSGQTIAGKILVTLVFLLNIAALTIYFIDAHYFSGAEECIDWLHRPRQQADFGINMCFLLLFILRFLAAEDRFWFMMEVYSMVDFLTVPPSFVSLYLNRTWLGLRFTRAAHLTQTPDVLQYLGILRSAPKIRLSQLVFSLTSIWLTAAGFIHLVENSGSDISQDNATAAVLADTNFQAISYFESAYLVIVTLTTVGYGDITCHTLLGRWFMMIFLILGLAYFASAIPEISKIFSGFSRYNRNYEKESSKKHVVLCGSITYQSVHDFISDFYHEDHEEVQVELVIIDREPPDLELESLLKCNFTRIHYFQGSVLGSKDLRRVQMHCADACLVLASRDCEDADAEDMANILRIVSIKSHHPEIRIIVQLLKFQSKAYLNSIPQWNHNRYGDTIICQPELKLGIIAQSCLVPGFSTMLSNLFITRSSHEPGSRWWQCGKKHKLPQEWPHDYLEGSDYEMYHRKLSTGFQGMKFSEIVNFCYKTLESVLFAIEVEAESGVKELTLNPHTDKIMEDEPWAGYFLAKSARYVESVSFYCNKCHVQRTNWRNIKKCKCANRGIKNPEEICSSPKTVRHGVGRGGVQEGMLHLCDPQELQHVTINRKTETQTIVTNIPVLTKHIIVCLFGTKDSPRIGLESLIRPLRGRYLQPSELQHVVIIGDPDYISKEWRSVCRFPHISVLIGSSLSPSLLALANVDSCSSCVIISARSKCVWDRRLIDEASILCSLNLRQRLSGLSPNLDLQDQRTFIITDIKHDENAVFLSPNPEDDDLDLYKTVAFASGAVFASSMLDCLVSEAYYNRNTLKLIRALISGGMMVERNDPPSPGGSLLKSGSMTSQLSNDMDHCRVVQMEISDLMKNIAFTNFSAATVYRELFLSAVKKGIICLGIYRLNPDPDDMFRYVVTNPLPDYKLTQTDKVFALIRQK